MGSQTPSKTEIIIRHATPDDIPQIARLGSTTFSTTFGYSLPPHDLEAYINSAYSHSKLLSELQDPTITILIACLPSDLPKVIGFMVLNRASANSEPCLASLSLPVNSLIELQRLYVDPTAQGLGVGKTLIGEGERIAREEGWLGMWLGVWEENIKAQGVYLKAGFERCGEHGFVMGETTQMDWIMWKELV